MSSKSSKVLTKEVAPLTKEDSVVTTSHLPARLDPLAAYLAEVRRYPMLSREEEYRLAVEYHRTHEPRLAQRLVTANLRFVVKVAAEYAQFGAQMLDLIQEGNVGLMHAVREFDPYKDVRLITYAVWWIRGYIREYLLKQHSIVKMGASPAQKKLFYNLQKEIQKLEGSGILPTTERLSHQLALPEKSVQDMQNRLKKDMSLDQPLDKDSQSRRLLDLQSSDAQSATDEVLSRQEQLVILRENVKALTPHLNQKERYILKHRLLADSPKTLQEIGHHFSITRERVRQLEVRILKRLQRDFASKTGETLASESPSVSS